MLALSFVVHDTSGHSPVDGLLAQLPPAWLYRESRGKLSRTYPGRTLLATERVDRRLTTILAADVAGYSRLTGLDEEGTHAQLQEHPAYTS